MLANFVLTADGVGACCLQLAFCEGLVTGEADQELDPGESSPILKVILQLFFVKIFKFINIFLYVDGLGS
jgi:hypothetical protein